jgi:hypothetical protein
VGGSGSDASPRGDRLSEMNPCTGMRHTDLNRAVYDRERASFMPMCPDCKELLIDSRTHQCPGALSEWPEQPDGIDENESEYPDPVSAAERVNLWISEWGDGLIEVLNGRPLYARDLASLAREALRSSVAAAEERERIYREVRAIPAWGTLEEREDHGGFDVPGENPRALVLAAIRSTHIK